MEDPNPPSLTLPPGCRFYPSEEQILCYYLPKKNSIAAEIAVPQPSNGCFDAIKEINFSSFNPFDLPEITCFRFGYRGRKTHWYCYTERINGEDRERRRAGLGFWKRKGRVKDVLGGKGGKMVLGRRSCYVFHMEKHCHNDDDSDREVRDVTRTDWIMYEYSLIENIKASFVLCRVFIKSRSVRSVSDIALSSCAEESVGTVRHIGIKRDGSITTYMGEAGANEHEPNDRNDPPAGVSTRLVTENLKLSPGVPSRRSPVRSPELVCRTPTLEDMISDHELTSILEGDYIELDDLI